MVKERLTNIHQTLWDLVLDLPETEYGCALGLIEELRAMIIRLDKNRNTCTMKSEDTNKDKKGLYIC